MEQVIFPSQELSARELLYFCAGPFSAQRLHRFWKWKRGTGARVEMGSCVALSYNGAGTM